MSGSSAVAGSLLIQIAADTKDLKSGLASASGKVGSFVDTISGHVKEIKKQFRLVNQVMGGAGAMVVLHALQRQFEAVTHAAKEMGAQSRAAGLSVSEFSGGQWSDESVRIVEELVTEFEKLNSAIMALATDALAAVAPAIQAIINAAKTGVSDPVAASKAYGKATLGFMTFNAGLVSSAAGDLMGGGGPTAVDAKAEAGQMARDRVMRERLINASTKAADERRQKEAEEAAKRAGKLDEWLQKEEQRKAQIELDAMKAEEERIKRREALREEQEQWRAQIEIDAMLAEEEARKELAEKTASIIDGRSGIAAVERGTQAAFSATNRSNVQNRQLTALQQIERNTRTAGAETETVEAL